MRRNSKEKDKKLSEVSPHLPILRWILCERCGYEFKGEEVWFVVVEPGELWGRMDSCSCRHTHYFCKECFPTFDAIKQFTTRMKNGYPMKQAFCEEEYHVKWVQNL